MDKNVRSSGQKNTSRSMNDEGRLQKDIMNKDIEKQQDQNSEGSDNAQHRDTLPDSQQNIKDDNQSKGEMIVCFTPFENSCHLKRY